MKHNGVKLFSFLLLLVIFQLLVVSCSTIEISEKTTEPELPTSVNAITTPTLTMRLPAATKEPKKPTVTVAPSITNDNTSVVILEEQLYIHHDPGTITSVGISGDGFMEPNHYFSNGSMGLMTVFIRFAHYSDRFVYIDDSANVWLDGLDAEERIFVTQLDGPPDDLVAAFRIEWTPDDMHFIFHFPDSWQQENLIYHLSSGALEKWDYQCDRLAISPKTNRVAVWCPQVSGKDNAFAVLDWGEEIWYSDRLPANPILDLSASNEYLEIDRRDPFPIVQLVGWAPKGNKIAYFDLLDGDLEIIDNQGKALHEIEKAAYFLSDFYSIYKEIPPKPIQWAGKSDRLLLYGVESSQMPCPREVELLELSMPEYETSSCWSIIDTSSGEILWRTPKDFFDYMKGVIEHSGYSYLDAAISSTGKQVALAITIPGFSTVYMIDTQLKTEEELPVYAWEVHFGK